MTVEELVHRCELCGVIVAAPPEDTSRDVLCPECTEQLAEARVAALREAFDWEAIAYDLAHLPVIWDAEVASVVGEEQAWRGTTPHEQNRIVQVITAHYRGKPS